MTLLDASPFTDYIDGAAYGYEFDTLKTNRAMVRPTEAPSEAEQTYDNSARVAIDYDLYFEFDDRTAAHERISGIQNAVREKLGDGGIALYTALTSTPGNLNGGSLVVELGLAQLTTVGDVRPHDETLSPDTPILHYPVTVRAWQSYA